MDQKEASDAYLKGYDQASLDMLDMTIDNLKKVRDDLAKKLKEVGRGSD